jgi:MoxR-like ATPase
MPTPTPHQLIAEKSLGVPFGRGLNADTETAKQKIASSAICRQDVINFLAKQGLPEPSLRKTADNSLALAFTIPSYLRSWRNRVNPTWALLGGDDDEETNAQVMAALEAGLAEQAQGQARTPVPPPAMPQISDKDLQAKIDAMIETKVQSTKVQLDPSVKDQIKALAAEAAKATMEANAKPRTIAIHDTASGTVRNVGLQHERFETLLRAATARDHKGYRLNIWLTGPTGSGKTTAAQNVAKALGLPFGSDGSLDTDYKVLGFRDANGHIISTQFLEIYTKGGVYVADEIDNWLPSALLSLNAALANGFASAPGGLVERHKDCVVIACANTWGHGATNEYVGRTKQDAATLDRFQPKIHWPVDERLEAAIADATASRLGIAWHNVIKAGRKAVATQGLKIIISPRATLSGIALLQAGFSPQETMDMTLAAGVSPEQKTMIHDACRSQMFALNETIAAARGSDELENVA